MFNKSQDVFTNWHTFGVLASSSVFVHQHSMCIDCIRLLDTDVPVCNTVCPLVLILITYPFYFIYSVAYSHLDLWFIIKVAGTCVV